MPRKSATKKRVLNPFLISIKKKLNKPRTTRKRSSRSKARGPRVTDTAGRRYKKPSCQARGGNDCSDNPLWANGNRNLDYDDDDLFDEE